MNTISILPETIVAGFLILLVIILFIFLQQSDEELSNAFKYFNTISGGATAILLSIAFGLSVIFGTLSHRVGKDLSILYYKLRRTNPPITTPPSGNNDVLLQDYYNKWLAKSFYRTLMMVSPFIMVETIMLDNRYFSGGHLTTILLIGIVLEIIFVISFFTQRTDSLNNT